LQKGLASMDSAQSVSELKKEVRVVGEALKFNNSRMLGLERLAEAQFKSKICEVDRVQNIETQLAALRLDLGKLVATLSSAFNLGNDAKNPSVKGSGESKYVS
jgi:hypothetical protein